MQFQVVHTLTDGIVPSPELVSTIKRLYDKKLKVTTDHHLYMFNFCPNKESSFYFVIKHFFFFYNMN